MHGSHGTEARTQFMELNEVHVNESGLELMEMRQSWGSWNCDRHEVCGSEARMLFMEIRQA